MPRTIVYSRPAPTGMGKPAASQKEDDYSVKLAKYVPAEVLAFYLPATIQFGEQQKYLYVIFAVGLVGTLLFLLNAAQREKDPLKKPYPYFYVLATIAYIAWGLGVSTTMDKAFGIDQALASLILTVVVFLLPGVDIALSAWILDRAKKRQTVASPTSS